MTDRTLYCHDHVNQPYSRVCDVLLADPSHVFGQATAAAKEGAARHARVAGIEIGAEVAIQIVGVERDYAYNRPALKISLEWRAASHPRIFPTMKAALVIFALTATETQLELRGAYQPPMGKLGEVLDAAAGYRLAESAATRFVQQVAGWLREALAAQLSPRRLDPATAAPS